MDNLIAIMENVDDGYGGTKTDITFSTIEEMKQKHKIIVQKADDKISILPGSVVFVPYGYHYQDGERIPRYLKVTTDKEYSKEINFFK